MQVAESLMMASVGLTIFGSSTRSKRTSPGPCMTVAYMTFLLRTLQSFDARAPNRRPHHPLATQRANEEDGRGDAEKDGAEQERGLIAAAVEENAASGRAGRDRQLNHRDHQPAAGFRVIGQSLAEPGPPDHRSCGADEAPQCEQHSGCAKRRPEACQGYGDRRQG